MGGGEKRVGSSKCRTDGLLWLVAQVQLDVQKSGVGA